MKVIKHLLSAITCCILVFLALASATNSDIVIERVEPKYDFQPPTEGVEKALSKTSFLLMTPKLNERKKGQAGPGQKFFTHLEADFEEMLIARGFTYKGPIESYDEIVYADKRDHDLVMEVELFWNLEGNFTKHKDILQYDGGTVRYYYIDGNCSIDGKLNIYLSEPFTHTKVFVKSVSVPETTFLLQSQKKYRDVEQLANDVLVQNTLTENYEKIYVDILNTSWKQLDPREIEIKKGEANEIKKNSTFKRD